MIFFWKSTWCARRKCKAWCDVRSNTVGAKNGGNQERTLSDAMARQPGHRQATCNRRRVPYIDAPYIYACLSIACRFSLLLPNLTQWSVYDQYDPPFHDLPTLFAPHPTTERWRGSGTARRALSLRSLHAGRYMCVSAAVHFRPTSVPSSFPPPQPHSSPLTILLSSSRPCSQRNKQTFHSWCGSW